MIEFDCRGLEFVEFRPDVSFYLRAASLGHRDGGGRRKGSGDHKDVVADIEARESGLRRAWNRIRSLRP